MSEENKADEEQSWIPFLPISTRTTESNLTGDWRTLIPYLSRKLALCQDACPAGQDIPEILNLLKQEKFKEAWELLIKKNPLPWSTASVCKGFCEQACNRKEFDEAVAFNKIEKFLGKMALEKKWFPHDWKSWTPQRKKVAVIGSGPAGLSCAYQLAWRGYRVSIFEASSVFGGLMKTAIPEDRLQKDTLEKEIKRNIFYLPTIIAQVNYRVNEKKFAEIREKFDAIFIATGSHRSKKLDVPGEDAKAVIYGLDLLKHFNLGQPLELGERVIIIGDGNTAIDCAHCVSKIPDKQVFVFCEKPREDIPDFLQKGIRAAEKQGVEFFFLIECLEIHSENSKLKGIWYRCADEPCYERYSPTDNLIIAVGEEPDHQSFITQDFSPAIDGIFIGGDAATQASNVAAAIASGREGAEKIIAYLEGRESQNSEEQSEEPVVRFDDLNTAYFEHQPRNKKIPDSQTAIKEAERCFSCGTCVGCGICQDFCPDVAVSIAGAEQDEEQKKGPKIDEKHCKGCGICAHECPRGVIKMKIEEKKE